MGKRKNVDWKPLGEKEKRELAKWAAGYSKLARSNDSMRELGRDGLDAIFWYWTADALDPEGYVVRDAIKYNFSHLPHTAGARSQLELNQRDMPTQPSGWGRGLQHEHVIPKAALIRVIMANRLNADAIYELLSKFCCAAIVTPDEHKKLAKVSDDWMNLDPFDRYRGVKLYPPRKR
ncbi:MAG: hypothetical protein R3B89_34850 [Polyangiaceae bacterium]